MHVIIRPGRDGLVPSDGTAARTLKGYFFINPCASGITTFILAMRFWSEG